MKFTFSVKVQVFDGNAVELSENFVIFRTSDADQVFRPERQVRMTSVRLRKVRLAAGGNHLLPIHELPHFFKIKFQIK